ncbi:MAG: flagellar biosynthetic protein FliO [Tepidimonas sp.]|uniref:FliO/MopB family protein n=1 Tax=Tepidimonas sp. TaxID=2002775 RepID=UPI00298EEDBA|nr:flagellar biosynthetic protein FliO [Tepidimonas sp.]MCS6811606.1 flagellar biosynthetic protein FliO [Tepidimonas sp.]MDW8336812.1 flagellar biosynthetic protein FliO [Tepidimonas sp.]
MTMQWTAWLPALGLLALLAALAWGVQWLRRRQGGGGAGAVLRVTSQLMVGPQQRVVVVELDGPTGSVQLTLGVTPQHVRTLHVAPLGTRTPPPPARYAEVARTLADTEARREPTP